jgi:hypothetical protein
MLEPENQIKTVIASIVSPFATASAVLLFVLSFVEYFRKGFVSLFLDFRILVIVTLALWAIAVFTEAQLRQKWVSSISLGLALGAGAPIIWKLAAPFGRLGLITFACGVAVLTMILIASIKTNKENNS